LFWGDLNFKIEFLARFLNQSIKKMSEGTGSDLFEDFQSFSENPEEGETKIDTDTAKPGRKNSRSSRKQSNSSNSKQKIRKTSGQSQPSPIKLDQITEGDPAENLPSEQVMVQPSEQVTVQPDDPQISDLQPVEPLHPDVAIENQIPNEIDSAAGDSDDLFEDFEGQTPGQDLNPEIEKPEPETPVVVEPKELSIEQ
jgi:hypothetical protein